MLKTPGQGMNEVLERLCFISCLKPKIDPLFVLNFKARTWLTDFSVFDLRESSMYVLAREC